MAAQPFTEQNLILTGYTGPNRPLVGRQIAERLRMPFLSVERQFEERAGMTVEEMRGAYGEARLKTIENELMAECVLRRSTVIQVSGRTLLNTPQLEDLQMSGLIICLVATLDAVLHRLHLSMGARYHSPHERALALGQVRQHWAVRALPGVHELDVTYLSEPEIIERVAQMWMQLALVRE